MDAVIVMSRLRGLDYYLQEDESRLIRIFLLRVAGDFLFFFFRLGGEFADGVGSREFARIVYKRVDEFFYYEISRRYLAGFLNCAAKL